MINQQLIDFIKEQLEKGVDKDIISKGLLENNWTKKDIEEGFNAINIHSKIESPVSNLNLQSNHLDTSVLENNHVALKVVITVLGLFLLAGGAFGYFLRNDIPFIKNLIKSKDIPVNEIQKIDIEPQIKQEDIIKEEPIVNESNKEIELTSEDKEKRETLIDDSNVVDKVIVESIAQ